MKNKVKNSTSSLTLGIIGTVFAPVLPIVTYPCSIVGLILSALHLKEGRKRAGIGMALNIVALVVAVISSVLAVLIVLNPELRKKINMPKLQKFIKSNHKI